MPCLRPAPRPTLPDHPLFAPWHREICETAPTVVGLDVPRHMKKEPIDPGAGDCFAHGRIAYLGEPQWPSCGICSRPLEMCLQVSPAVVAEFLPGGRGLCAMFCFHCGVKEGYDPRVRYVRLVEPRFRVVGPEAWKSASSGWMAESQRVTPRPRAAVVPGASWYRHRGWTARDTASGWLFVNGEHLLKGRSRRGGFRELGEICEVYDAWIEGRGIEETGGAEGVWGAWPGGIRRTRRRSVLMER